MRVFVTGAAGFIGTAVVQDLLQNGHQVIGLARSDANAEAITKAGGEVLRGDLNDIESLKSGAKQADGVIHLAFMHDFADFAKATEVDRAAITAMGEAIAGTGKPLIIASGTLGHPVAPGQYADEDTEAERVSPMSIRAKSADLVKRFAAEKGVRGMVIQLCPTVHGAGDKGMLPRLMNLAKQKGFVTYIGDGSARWPAVHRDDAAVLFRLALEKGTAGATYNAVAESGIPMKEIMTVIGKGLDLPVESKSVPEAMQAIGFMAHVIGMDNPTTSEKTQKALGWTPTHPKLIPDLEASYFN